VRNNFILLAAIGLTACGPGYPTKSGGTPTGVRPSATVDVSTENEKLADAMKLVAEKDWPKALLALQAVIEATTFASLSTDVQFRTCRRPGESRMSMGNSGTA
jgi:hypothetical protein